MHSTPKPYPLPLQAQHKLHFTPKWNTTSWFNPLCDEVDTPEDAAPDEADPRLLLDLQDSSGGVLVGATFACIGGHMCAGGNTSQQGKGGMLQAQPVRMSSLLNDPLLRSKIAIQRSGLSGPSTAGPQPKVRGLFWLLSTHRCMRESMIGAVTCRPSSQRRRAQGAAPGPPRRRHPLLRHSR